MRTTLKRGSGLARTEDRPDVAPARNGNGNGNGNGGPPVMPRSGGAGPPAPPLRTMTRYGGGGRRGLRLAGRIATGVVVFLLVAAGALGGGIWLYLDRTVATISAPKSASQAEVISSDVLAAPEAGAPAVALVVGADVRQGPEHDGGRSDTVMLIRADPDKQTLSMLSFPRDLVVDHPGCKRHPDPWRDKLNTAYAYCGEVGVVNTIRDLTGIQPNYLITVNFHGFKEIVNKVGGVYVDVDHRYFNDDTGPGGYARINVKPGYQRLTGGAALDFARYRHLDSDFHRMARQQQFVTALKQSIEASFTPSKLPGVVNAIANAVFVGRGGGDRVGLEEVLGYAQFLYELPSGNVFQTRVVGSGYNDVTASDSELNAAVQAFLSPDTTASRRATAAVAGKKPPEPVLTPAAVLISVKNGNGVTGDAQLAAELLHEQGYSISTTGDADRFDYFDTVVRYDPTIAGSDKAAKQVATLFDGVAEPAPAGTEMAGDTLHVILGSTFHGNLGEVQREEQIDDSDAAVTRDFDAVLPYLEDAAARVSFPLLVPEIRESYSTLDSQVPVRQYRIEDPNGDFHDAVKIVYSSSAGYWGVMETSWAEAPILTGFNATRKTRDRTLQLYFNGGRIRMVAFVENGAAYWVSNTLDDRLSNRTMIAIAKGLRPMPAGKPS